MNTVCLVGRVGLDTEVKYFESGASMARNRLAVKKYSAEQGEGTTWLTVKAWGKTAQTMGEYVKKGRQIAIEGHLEVEEWTAQDGTSKSETIVMVDHFDFVGTKPTEEVLVGARASDGNIILFPEDE